MGARVTQRGYFLGLVSRRRPCEGFQAPSSGRLPQMQALSPNLVSQVAANSILKLVINVIQFGH
jgi:hypothetical protein